MAKLTLYNVAICLVVALGGFTYGFGFAVFISSIGQPGFFLYFSLDRKSLTVLLWTLCRSASTRKAGTDHTVATSTYTAK